MEQRDESWHAERAGKINASEAGALLGMSPYTSAKAARKRWIEEGRGMRRDFDSFDMRRGRDLEALILNGVEQVFGEIIMQDAGRLHQGWLRASADGWIDFSDDARCMVEVKAPRKFFDANDRPDYLLQLYLQMVCYKAQHGILVQGVEVDGHMELRGEGMMYSLDELAAVIDQYTDGTPPLVSLFKLHAEMAAEAAQDAPEVEEAPEAFEVLQVAYLTAKQALVGAQNLVDEIKEQLLEACDHQPVVGTRLQVIEATRQGSVNYKALSKAHPEVDLDEYRGKPSTYYTIKEMK